MLELKDYSKSQTIDWLALAESIGQQSGSEELLADDSDCFVTKNFTLLKESGLTGAGVPVEFGGGGASYREICDILRILGRHCSSTALALSMHTHQVMVNTWKWQHQNAPVDSLLRRVAQEQVMLLSTGGGDWLNSSGTATLTEGGFIINGCKGFVSGVSVGDLLITSAVYEDPTAGKTVLHFALPMNTLGVSVEPVWQAMGMRGTGSHNVRLSDVFVPKEKIALRRPAGKWHPAFHLITAIPIVYSVYVGIAEAARNLVVQQASKRQNDSHTCYLVGGLENELGTAKLALQQMIALSESNQPNLITTNQVMMGRTIVAKSVLNMMDLAMEIAGGRAFQRSLGLEKLFRDAQGVRYHPLREEVQRQLAGKLALGVSPDTL